MDKRKFQCNNDAEGRSVSQLLEAYVYAMVPAVCGQNSKSACPHASSKKFQFDLSPHKLETYWSKAASKVPPVSIDVSLPLLRAADRYAYTGCGSTAYYYLFYLGSELILIDIRKPFRSSTCLVRYSWSLSS